MENQTDKLSKEELKALDKETQLAMAERIEKATLEMRVENDRLVELQANQLLSGTGGGNIKPEAPVPLTDIEFANQVKLGLVNPLQADGYL